MQGFHDVRMPEFLSYGMRGGARYKTTIVEGAGGHEQRFKEWDDPRYRFAVALEYWDEDRLNDLLDFHHLRDGAAYGFRFKNWLDYLVGMRTGADGPELSTPQPFATGDGSDKTFQLAKVRSDAAATKSLKITRPVPGTVRVWANGVEATSGWTCDHSTGVVTFGAAPGNGVVLACALEYDLPARFESDDMDMTAEALMAGRWESFGVIGLKE